MSAFNRMRRGGRTPIGLDVGSRRIKAVQLEQTAVGLRVAAAAVAPRAATVTPIDDANGVGPAGLAPREVAALSDMLYRAGFEGRRLVLAAPSSALIQSVLELPPRTSQAPVEQIARLELARGHKCAPDSFEMGCWDLPSPHRSAKSTHMMAVGLPHAQADALLDGFEAAGLRVEAVDVGPCALARACAPAVSEAGITGMLDLGWGAGVLSLLHLGAVVYGRSLADAGIGHLHDSLARRLGLEADVVEYLLFDVGLGGADGHGATALGVRAGDDHRKDGDGGDDDYHDHDTPDDALALVAAHVDALAHELKVSFSYAGHQYPDAAVSKLLLVGGGATLPGLAARLASALHIPVTAATPAGLATCEPSLLQLCGSPVLTTAMGLAQFPEL